MVAKRSVRADRSAVVALTIVPVVAYLLIDSVQISMDASGAGARRRKTAT